MKEKGNIVMENNYYDLKKNVDKFLNLTEQQKEKIYETINQYNENKSEIDRLLWAIENEKNDTDVSKKSREALKKETANSMIMQTAMNLVKLFQHTVNTYILALDMSTTIFNQIGFEQLEKKVNEMLKESEYRFQRALKVWAQSHGTSSIMN